MAAMKTPGVYIVEKNAFPNSVVQVATAVPAFIGYTEKAELGATSLHDTPWRITSLSELHQYFGFAPTPIFDLQPQEASTSPSPLTDDGALETPALPRAIVVGSDASGDTKYELIQTNPAYCFYAAMRHFFLNGGGSCYVTSIGSYDDAFDADRMTAAITRLEKEPEPTLLVIPETTRLPRAKALSVQQAMLAHCGIKMKNRFALLDISGGYLPQNRDLGDPVATFRNDIGTTALGFGAAYYPWLNTTIYDARDFSFENITPKTRSTLISILKAAPDINNVTTKEIAKIGTPSLSGDFTLHVPIGGRAILSGADICAEDDTSTSAELRFEVLETDHMPGQLVTTGSDDTLSSFTQQELEQGKVSFVHDPQKGITGQFSLIATDKDGLATLAHTVFVLAGADAHIPDLLDTLLHDSEATHARDEIRDKTLRALSPRYTHFTATIADTMNTLPPAAAMAGLYTMVDNSRGVWKAPANVSVNSVTSPTVNVSHTDQENLNVSTTGKSINAIRPFIGEGTLVWGARTLDGNSLDWRYISVRRTMIMIEESIKLAAKTYVFEPNTANTWVTMRSMIENFLTGIWKQGGLAGATPNDAFSVRVGLGSTMTPNDILEGILRVSVLVAVTRPAEFIEITFEQQMQKS